MLITADEAYAEAERRIESARREGTPFLRFPDITALNRLPPMHDLPNVESLDLTSTRVSDISEIRHLTGLLRLALINITLTDASALQHLKKLKVLSLYQSRIDNLSPLQHLLDLEELTLNDTLVSDIRALHSLRRLKLLVLHRTNVNEISALKNLLDLRTLTLSDTQVLDLRPIAHLEFPFSRHSGGYGLSFGNMPATSADPKLAELSIIKDRRARTDQTLEYLRSLPPYPAPLPWEVPDQKPMDGAETEPELDPALPLIERQGRIALADTRTSPDPIISAVLEDVRPLLDTLSRKGNMHDDVYTLAAELKTRCAGADAEIDLLRLHLSYQKLNRLFEGRESRKDPFDDELVTTIASVVHLIPGATMAEPKVVNLIARQEANRAANTPHVLRAREEKILKAIAEPHAPFEPDLQDLATATADFDQTDRFAGTGWLLTRNVLVFSIRLLAKGSGKLASAFIAHWVVVNYDAILSFSLGMGADVYWWAKKIMDAAKAAFEGRSPGP